MVFFSTFDWDHLAKIPEYGWKKLPEISKFAKCPGLLKTNEIVSPQSRRILLTFVWLGGGGGVGVGTISCPPPTIQTSVKFLDFVEQHLRSLALHVSPLNSVNLQ